MRTRPGIPHSLRILTISYERNLFTDLKQALSSEI
jgi:hypothetical protein